MIEQIKNMSKSMMIKAGLGAVALALVVGAGLAYSSPAAADGQTDADKVAECVAGAKSGINAQNQIPDCEPVEENDTSVTVIDNGRVVVVNEYDYRCMTAKADANIDALAKAGIVGGMVFNDVNGANDVGFNRKVCVEAMIRITVDGDASITGAKKVE